jgi:hypothetical protein
MKPKGELTERHRVEAVRVILKQLYTLSERGLDKKYLGRIERETIFFLYECHSPRKFALERPHSAFARAKRKSFPDNLRIKSREHGLTYDHAIPLATIRAELRKGTTSTGAMHRTLKRFVQGVIITGEEDGLLSANALRLRMPDGAASDDKIARYRAVGITFRSKDKRLLTATIDA